MKTIFYERACSGCAIARRFLTGRSVKYESKDVRKNPISKSETLRLVKKQRVVHGMKGKKLVSYDLNKDKPTDNDLEKILIGRSGTLRAPCLQVGDIFIGGFNPALYTQILKL